ncbi:uncharacterized protein TNCV_2351801 [Trichonephila clavipes]|nr:uncharacterized protein TNCV_2351801 [Trichonephila clavipes]
MNKQANLPAYLKQLALEKIGDIPIDAVQVYTDGSRDDYYRSGSGIYIKSQDHILRIQRNPDGCSVFLSELIAIDEALGSLASLPNGKEIWILSDSRSAIQHLSNCCQVIYSPFGLAIHQNDHQARRRFVEWAQNEIAVVPDFHKRILFSDEAHCWLNGYVNKQNFRIWSEANPQVYVETPLHPEKLTVWCALWAGGILLQKR